MFKFNYMVRSSAYANCSDLRWYEK